MKNLLDHISTIITLTDEEEQLIKNCFKSVSIPAKTQIITAEKTEDYIYFIQSGFVKGYQNINGKIVVQHLLSQNSFFTSLDSFMNKTPSTEYYDTITNCVFYRIHRTEFIYLRENTTFWCKLVEKITNINFNNKLERVNDFQLLTAKERYLKFMQNEPSLVLNVSVDNIASFLGIKPQSLSRIKKEITLY